MWYEPIVENDVHSGRYMLCQNRLYVNVNNRIWDGMGGQILSSWIPWLVIENFQSISIHWPANYIASIWLQTFVVKSFHDLNQLL